MSQIPYNTMSRSALERTLKAVIYVRYSSHSQRDVSIDQQVRACRKFAERQGIEIVAIYEDRAMTGTSDKRPGFQKMIRDSEKCEWNYVIVYALDRFARDRYDSAVYKRKLKNNGIKVLSAMENISDDPTGVLMESLLEGLAEYYSKELSQKIQRGQEDNARRCLVNGSLPLGYKRGEDGRYAIDENEAPLVLEIFQRVKDQEPIADIIRDFNRRGLRTKHGCEFNKSSFNKILSNERYTGTYIYREIRVPGGIPAIVSHSLFDSVQSAVYCKANARKDPSGTVPQRRRREAGTYLLTGKLFCGKCKSPMVGLSGTSKSSALHFYYTCKGRRSAPGHCDKKNVSRDYIERFIAESLRDTMLNPEAIAALADAAIEYQNRNAISSELASLKEQLADVTKSLANLLTAIEAGIFTQTTQNRMIELEARKQDLERMINAATEAAEDQITREDIISTLECFKDGDISDKDYQEALIDTFLVAAYMYDDKIRFVFNLGGTKKVNDIPFDIDSIENPSVRNSTPGLHHKKCRLRAAFFYGGAEGESNRSKMRRE